MVRNETRRWATVIRGWRNRVARLTAIALMTVMVFGAGTGTASADGLLSGLLGGNGGTNGGGGNNEGGGGLGGSAYSGGSASDVSDALNTLSDAVKDAVDKAAAAGSSQNSNSTSTTTVNETTDGVTQVNVNTVTSNGSTTSNTTTSSTATSSTSVDGTTTSTTTTNTTIDGTTTSDTTTSTTSGGTTTTTTTTGGTTTTSTTTNDTGVVDLAGIEGTEGGALASAVIDSINACVVDCSPGQSKMILATINAAADTLGFIFGLNLEICAGTCETSLTSANGAVVETLEVDDPSGIVGTTGLGICLTGQCDGGSNVSSSVIGGLLLTSEGGIVPFIDGLRASLGLAPSGS